MRKWWPKLVIGLLLIALFLFLGIQLYRVILGLLGVIANDGGSETISAYSDEATWTQPPYYPDESDYDNVSAVREYEEPSPTATTAP